MELKIDFSNRKTIAGIIVLICVAFIVLYLPTLISSVNPTTCIENGICEHEQRLNLLTELVPFFILIGIIIGALVFFFMTNKLENKKKELEAVTNALMQFLNREEKAVVEKILENKGSVLQAEVSRIEGIGKLKSHRILQRLADRGVIQTEKYGKTNKIVLSKNIREALLK